MNPIAMHRRIPCRIYSTTPTERAGKSAATASCTTKVGAAIMETPRFALEQIATPSATNTVPQSHMSSPDFCSFFIAGSFSGILHNKIIYAPARFVKEIPSIAIDLVEVNDAPMTIIYPQGQLLAPNVMAEDGSVGIRIPMNEFCVDLVSKLRKPLVSTSANISGEPTPKNYDEIPQEIKDAVDYIVPKALGAGATGRASQILKVGLHGEIEIIRS